MKLPIKSHETAPSPNLQSSIFDLQSLLALLLLALLGVNAYAAEPPDEVALDVLVGNEVLDIASDQDDVWIATNKGLNRYHRETQTWSILTIADGLASNRVQSIAIERREGILGPKPGERVWFGTDSGLSMFHKRTGEWSTYTTRDGLLENDIRDISARGRDVWVLSRRGVSIYNVKKGSWTSYASFPGIQNAELTCVYHDAYYAWIGTTDGLIRYNYRQKRSLNAPTSPGSDVEVYGRWEFFTNRLSEWISPTGGGRSSENAPGGAEGPFPDPFIRSIDGNSRYVFIGTRTGLVRYEIKVPLKVAAEQAAYADLVRTGQSKRTSQYLASRNRVQARIAGVERIEGMKSIRKVLWEPLGWTFFQLSQRLLDRRAEVSDDMLDISLTRGEAWCATPRGLVRLDPFVGSYELFTRKKGFPATRIDTVSAAQGQIWAGTPHGVAVRGLFGNRWVRLRMERALPSNVVTAVGADQQWVWFGAPGAASRYDPGRDHWQTYTRDEGLAGDKIHAVAVVGNFVWFATNEGISRLDKHTGQIDHFGSEVTGLSSDEVTAILVDGRFVWVGSSQGLARYDKVEDTWQPFSQALPVPEVHALVADPYYLWVGTPQGLVQYDKQQDRWHTFGDEMGLSEKAVEALATNERYLFVAGHSELDMWDRRTRQWRPFTAHSGIPSAIRTLAADEGGVWIGFRGGIAHLKLPEGAVRRFGDADVAGLSRVDVLAATVADEYVWFGTNNGVYRYNRKTGEWWTYAAYRSRGETDILIDSNIQAIAVNDSTLYVGTPLGMSRFDKLLGNWVNTTREDGLPDSDVRAILLEGNDVWIATPRGVGYYDFVADTWRTYTRRDGLPGNNVLALAKGEAGLWVGTTTGAARLNRETATWEALTVRDGLPDEVVQAVVLDGANVWFGTPEGIAILNTELNIWNWYTQADGLVSNDVRSIYMADPYLFINTPAGTSVYDRELGSFSTFTQADGLKGNLVQSLDAAQRYFWFGTPGGLTLYDLIPDLSEQQYDATSGLPGDNVQAVTLDLPFVWIGTDAGLARYDQEKGIWTFFRAAPRRGKETRAAGLLSHNIKSLADAGEILWVGTRLGLSRYDKVQGGWRRMELAQTGMVRVIELDGRLLWLGTPTGLALFDTASERVIESKPGYAPVRDIRRAPDGSLWFLCPDQLIRMVRDRREDVWVRIQGARRIETVSGVTRIREAKGDLGIQEATCMEILGDQIWIGRERGLVVYEPRKHRSVAVDLPEALRQAKVTDLTRDGETLWVGTRQGIFRYEPDPTRWTHWTVKDGLADDRVSVIATDRNAIWIGTADSGVSRYDKVTQRWKHFRFGDGPSDHNIRAIVPEERYVWFGTFSGGVCRYDKTNGLWTTYRTADYVRSELGEK